MPDETRYLPPDIFAHIFLMPREFSPKKFDLATAQYRTILYFNHSGFDCRILLHQYGGNLLLGATYENVPIRFLCRQNAEKYLLLGKLFKLWELDVFAIGRITKVCAAIPTPVIPTTRE
jgi:hypothetical protein